MGSARTAMHPCPPVCTERRRDLVLPPRAQNCATVALSVSEQDAMSCTISLDHQLGNVVVMMVASMALARVLDVISSKRTAVAKSARIYCLS